jgi:hypothetical protein
MILENTSVKNKVFFETPAKAAARFTLCKTVAAALAMVYLLGRACRYQAVRSFYRLVSYYHLRVYFDMIKSD